MNERPCASCGATELEPGLLLDVVEGGARPAAWVPGEPQYGPLGGLKFRNKDHYAVEAYRCAECGYLNLFVGEQTYY